MLCGFYVRSSINSVLKFNVTSSSKQVFAGVSGRKEVWCLFALSAKQWLDEKTGQILESPHHCSYIQREQLFKQMYDQHSPQMPWFFEILGAQKKQNSTIPRIQSVLKASGFLSAMLKLGFKVSEGVGWWWGGFYWLNCLWCFLKWNGWCTALDMEAKTEITGSDQSVHLLPIYKQIIFNQLLGNVPRTENENIKISQFPCWLEMTCHLHPSRSLC